MGLNNMQDNLLSVVIITYKQFQYIYETIDSILKQDYPAIEIVVADDGSPNFPDCEIRQYIEMKRGENLKCYKLLHDEINVGTVKNINKGIRNSTGKFIKIIAGDDTYHDKYVFTTQIEYLKANPEIMIVTGKTCECDADMNPIFKEQVQKTNNALLSIFQLEPKAYFDKCGKEGLFPLVTQALCFRHSFFDQYGFYDETYRLLEDPPMEKRIIINRVPIAAVDWIIVNHRADVGISANNELFSNKRQQYYLDLTNYVKNELLSRPHIFSPFKTKWRYRTEKFRYEMSIAKDKKQKIKVLLKNIDTIIMFWILRPQTMLKKIKILFRVKLS